MRASDLARQTPETRNRYVDLLRILAISAVVLGHFFLSVITRADGGGLTTVNILAVAPWTHYLTWLVQVMPVFFIVGAWANKASWESGHRRGRSYADWVRARAERLLRPTAVFIVAWFCLGIALSPIVGSGVIELAGRTVAVPLWFLSVYVIVVAAAPAMLELHHRFGLLVPAGLTAGALVVDGLHHLAEIPYVGVLNFALVWLAIHQLGFFWHDGRIRPRAAAAMATGGFVALVALTSVGPYPISVVGVPGAEMSNNSPPTVVLIALGVFQVGALLLLEAPARRWLQRPRVWQAVIVGNANIMTIYLWHFSALVFVAAGLYLTPLMPDVERLSPEWWGLHGLEILAYLVGLIPLVLLFGRFERAILVRRSGAPHAMSVLMAVACMSAGLALLAANGLHAADQPAGIPWVPVTLLAAGMALVSRGGAPAEPPLGIAVRPESRPDAGLAKPGVPPQGG